MEARVRFAALACGALMAGLMTAILALPSVAGPQPGPKGQLVWNPLPLSAPEPGFYTVRFRVPYIHIVAPGDPTVGEVSFRFRMWYAPVADLDCALPLRPQQRIDELYLLPEGVGPPQEAGRCTYMELRKGPYSVRAGDTVHVDFDQQLSLPRLSDYVVKVAIDGREKDAGDNPDERMGGIIASFGPSSNYGRGLHSFETCSRGYACYSTTFELHSSPYSGESLESFPPVSLNVVPVGVSMRDIDRCVAGQPPPALEARFLNQGSTLSDPYVAVFFRRPDPQALPDPSGMIPGFLGESWQAATQTTPGGTAELTLIQPEPTSGAHLSRGVNRLAVAGARSNPGYPPGYFYGMYWFAEFEIECEFPIFDAPVSLPGAVSDGARDGEPATTATPVSRRDGPQLPGLGDVPPPATTPATGGSLPGIGDRIRIPTATPTAAGSLPDITDRSRFPTATPTAAGSLPDISDRIRIPTATPTPVPTQPLLREPISDIFRPPTATPTPCPRIGLIRVC